MYKLENGNFARVQGTGKDGVFDPGENSEVLLQSRYRKRNLKMSEYFFKVLNNEGVKLTIFADLDKGNMEVVPAKPFGKGLEANCRFRAVGSFDAAIILKRLLNFPTYVENYI